MEGDAGGGQPRAALRRPLWVAGAGLNQPLNPKPLGIDFPNPPPPQPPLVPLLVGPFNNYDARVNVNQTLFDWSSVQRVRAAGAQADGSRAERGVTVEGSVLTAAIAYVRAVRAQSVVG